MQNRHNHLGEVIRSLRQAQVPARTPKFDQATQQSLWS